MTLNVGQSANTSQWLVPTKRDIEFRAFRGADDVPPEVDELFWVTIMIEDHEEHQIKGIDHAILNTTKS